MFNVILSLSLKQCKLLPQSCKVLSFKNHVARVNE